MEDSPFLPANELDTVMAAATVIIWEKSRRRPELFSVLPKPHFAGECGCGTTRGHNSNRVEIMFIASQNSGCQVSGRSRMQQPWEMTSSGEDHFDARPNRPVQIVIVEDNPGDVDLLRQALSDQQIAYHLLVLEDGRKALSFFEGVVREGRELPSFIILDLNLPAISGLSILERIRGVPCLNGIPVAILTSSTLPEERDRARAVGVDAYWSKPHSLDELDSLGRSLSNFFHQYNIISNT